jgi:histidine triad (HIT) family protein
MMSDCLFCKIIRKEIPSEIVHQDQSITVIKDINPAAPVHLLVIPHKHLPSVREMGEGDEILLGKVFSAAKAAAEKVDIAGTGYRLIINNGPDAHQEIDHFHMHVLGGGKMKHPMG